jgi:NAD(P)-dependent dehydrogenase (short-subunit alcohol dehydrogenase family)
MEDRLGSVDDVVAPIGGWWAGKRLWGISEGDWQDAFVRLATTHMAVARAALPRMKAGGAYSLIAGASAAAPVPGSAAGREPAGGPGGGVGRAMASCLSMVCRNPVA